MLAIALRMKSVCKLIFLVSLLWTALPVDTLLTKSSKHGFSTTPSINPALYMCRKTVSFGTSMI